MTQTWESAWDVLEQGASLSKRDGQQKLGHAVFDNVFNGGQLVAEGPTGVGKSFTALVPAISALKNKNQRTILTTETLSLLDQIVDKDLPFLEGIYGEFTYFGLKGRNQYLCRAKAGKNNPIVEKLGTKIDNTLGERRDVERILRRRLDDDDWAEISGDSEFCAHNQCKDEICFSAAARTKAANADIVVTSHKMLQIHGEFVQQTGEGLLGDFEHIVVDEAHSLEAIVVDGLSLTVAPWELNQKMNHISKGIDQINVFNSGDYDAQLDQLRRNTEVCLKIIKDLFTFQIAGEDMESWEWGRQSMLLSEISVLNPGPEHEIALDLYEQSLPQTLLDTYQGYESLAKSLLKEAENVERGAGKVRKAANASMYLSKLLWLVMSATTTKTGTVEAYGTTYAMFADGYVGRDMNGSEKLDLRLRAVPLDISQFLRRNLWSEARSVTVISATLRDHTDGSFRFLKRSLGLSREYCKEIVVDSPFDFTKQQLVYLTPATQGEIIDVPGARFSMEELASLIDATDGRALVLFTSIAELNYVASRLRADKNFPYTLLVQEKGADKAELAKKFKEDTHSVFLATKSFFQGFDVPGEALTSLIMCKYSLPQYNATTKSLVRYWSEQGFSKWYEMKSIETFVQAWGRLIRSNGCKGVVSLLDNRVVDPQQNIHKIVHKVVPSVYGGVEITDDVDRVRSWLDS